MVKKNPNIPDSMLQVVAWIMGEYGSTHPDLEKRNKILKHLCNIAYRPLEDELTRSYILSAVTKLHSTMGFPEQENIKQVMDDFALSRHVDVQQRAVEYKNLKANAGKFSQDILMNTPMNETSVLMQGFDFDLKFLDSYVQS